MRQAAPLKVGHLFGRQGPAAGPGDWFDPDQAGADRVELDVIDQGSKVFTFSLATDKDGT